MNEHLDRALSKRERTLAEADNMVAALRQYRDDMKYVPKEDSRQRRVDMIDAMLARIDGGAK